ncbi:MAG: Gfo/Idh/MocA family oxidoreductase [Planctomycetota bacterium]
MGIRLYYTCPMMYPDCCHKPFFYKKEVSGGLIIDQAIHLLDITRYLLGHKIKEVHAYGANEPVAIRSSYSDALHSLAIAVALSQVTPSP